MPQRFSWDVKQIASALKISETDVKEYFTDGRRVSFILERRLAYEVFKGKISESEEKDYDILDSKGKKWEVRSITEHGVYFCPSYMVGSGRSFNEAGFLRKLKELEGYVVCDVTSFPDVPFYVVKKEDVLEWWNQGLLGTTTKISRDKIKMLLIRQTKFE